jgi:hypothetical protein
LEAFEMPEGHRTRWRISAAGVRRLGEMQGLRRIVCSLPHNLPPEEFAPLGRLKNLEYLDLFCNGLTSDHMRTLGQLTRLQKLRLFGYPANSDKPLGVHHLANHARLEELRLYGVTDEDMPFLMKMKSLVRLQLPQDRVSEDLFEQLTGLPALEHLAVESTNRTERYARLRRKFSNIAFFPLSTDPVRVEE